MMNACEKTKCEALVILSGHLHIEQLVEFHHCKKLLQIGREEEVTEADFNKKYRISRPDKTQDPNRIIPDNIEFISYKQATSILEKHFKEKSWDRMMTKEKLEESSSLQNISLFVSKKLYLDQLWPTRSHYNVTRFATNAGRLGSFFKKRNIRPDLVNCRCGALDSPIHRLFECDRYDDVRVKHKDIYQNLNPNSIAKTLKKDFYRFGRLCHDLTDLHWQLFPRS